MDTSPEYINMCRRAKELQEMWKPSHGDWFVLYDEIETIGDYSDDLHPIDYREEYPVSKKNCVWLPRIDQLIDMMGNDLRPDEGFTMTIKNRKTTEQELLNEHYKNTCHKSWNGEDWIKL